MEALGILRFIFGSGAMFFGIVAWSQISVLRKEFGEIWKQINETPNINNTYFCTYFNLICRYTYISEWRKN